MTQNYQEGVNLEQAMDGLQGVDTLDATHVASLQDIFGGGSSSSPLQENIYQYVGKMVGHSDTSTQLFFLILVTVLLSLVVYLFTYYRKPISSVMKSITYRDALSRIVNEIDVNVERALSFSSFVSPLFIAYFILLYMLNFAHTELTIPLQYLTLLMLLVVMAVYRWCVVGVFSYINENKSIKLRYTLLRHILSFVFIIVLAPIILLFSYVSLSSSLIWAALPIIFLFLLIICYLAMVYNIFRCENFSFLEYILYLCILEFIPISFIFIILVRYMGLSIAF